jgi:hypothetical protein
MNSFLVFEIIYFSIIYCNIDMSSEIIQSVAHGNYDDFQHVNFIFSQYSSSLFWGLFNAETDLSVSWTW